jgi:PAS domain S-box-containing protein
MSDSEPSGGIDRRTAVVGIATVSAIAAIVATFMKVAEGVQPDFLAALWATATFVVLLVLATASSALAVARRDPEIERRTSRLERLVAERTAALAESEARTRALLESDLQCVVTTDEKGTIESFSPGASHLLGWTQDDAIGKHVSMLMPEPHASAHDSYMGRYLATGEARIIGIGREVKGLRKDGTLVPLHLSIAEMRVRGRRTFMAVLRDTTERMQAAAELLESQRRLQAILDHTEAVIFAKDLEGRYLLVNRRAESLFGAMRGEMRNRTDFDVFPAAVAEALAKNDRAVLASGPMQFEETVPAADGPRTYLSTKFPLLDADGIAVAVCGISTDITDRKRAEGDLKRAKDAAESATLAKTEFLANMSHEIRTPLNAVIGMTALLLDTRLDPEQQECAETIRRSGEALLGVISDILDFSRIESGKLFIEESVFSLAQVVEESLDIAAPQAAAKGLDLCYHVEPDVPSDLFGDAGRIRQVLLNLLSNAVKFTERGEVSVWVRSRPLDGGRHELQFVVKDTGIGIAPDRRERLFRSFSQVDPSTTRRYGGSGLGLAISKALCELMGGRIGVDSEPGRGSEFHFTVAARVAPEREPESAETFVGRLVKKRVLVVDDGASSRQILETLTKGWGMSPRAVASGDEALSQLEEGPAFDVAIVDAKLADVDGVELVRRIAKSDTRRPIPCVLVTSLGQRPEAGVEFAAFVPRPVKPQLLMRALAKALGSGVAREEDQAPVRVLTPGELPRSLRILVAEDNAVNQRVVVRMIEKLGSRADVAASGLEVLAALDRQRYEVVLMDVQMPDMDGLAATRELRRRLRNDRRPTILAMTANVRREDEAACLEAGMDGFLAKPLRIEALRDALARAAAKVSTAAAGIAPVGPPLDTAAFSRLRALDRDAPGVVGEIVDLYLGDTPGRIGSLRAAAVRRNAEEMASLAHGLKGSSSYIGAREIEAICADIEHLLREGRRDEASARVAALDGALVRVREALLAARAEPPAPAPTPR